MLVALGGNAILPERSRGTAEEQLATVELTSSVLARLIGTGHDIAITHGNGPQVGDILLANEIASSVLPPMPLDFCGAESQGMIGYMLQQSLQNKLLQQKAQKKQVVTILTQTIVNESDAAFTHPTKPIGPYYQAEEADRLRVEKHWIIEPQKNGGFRRVVPSPNPVEIVESQLIRTLFEHGTVVISTGGGGIPVVKDPRTGTLRGVEGVIDKDLAAAVLASLLGVDTLMILTDVEGVFLNYGKLGQRRLIRLTVQKARQHIKDGQFPAGSMGPKIEAALRFVGSGGGSRRTIITSIEKAEAALEGEAGTLIVR